MIGVELRGIEAAEFQPAVRARAAPTALEGRSVKTVACRIDREKEEGEENNGGNERGGHEGRRAARRNRHQVTRLYIRGFYLPLVARSCADGPATLLRAAAILSVFTRVLAC